MGVLLPDLDHSTGATVEPAHIGINSSGLDNTKISQATVSMAVSLKHSADETVMKVFMQSMFSVVCCIKLIFAQSPQSNSLILLRSKPCKVTIMVTCLYPLPLIHLNAKPRGDTRFLHAPFPTRRSQLRQGGEVRVGHWSEADYTTTWCKNISCFGKMTLTQRSTGPCQI